jgi:hypothetical protein
VIAVWIVTALFGLLLAAMVSGTLAGHVLDRAHEWVLRGKARRALAERNVDDVLSELDLQLSALKEEEAELRTTSTRGSAILKGQALYQKICSLEDLRRVITDQGDKRE